MLKDYKDCLFNGDEVLLKSQQRFKSDHHKVYTEVNKIALSSDNDKRLQTFDGVETYPYGTNAFKVCETKMMVVRDLFVENYADFSIL